MVGRPQLHLAGLCVAAPRSCVAGRLNAHRHPPSPLTADCSLVRKLFSSGYEIADHTMKHPHVSAAAAPKDVLPGGNPAVLGTAVLCRLLVSPPLPTLAAPSPVPRR